MKFFVLYLQWIRIIPYKWYDYVHCYVYGYWLSGIVVCLGFLDVIAATDAVAAAVCLFCFVFWFMIIIMINEEESIQIHVYRNDAIFDKHQCGICQMMEKPTKRKHNELSKRNFLISLRFSNKNGEKVAQN